MSDDQKHQRAAEEYRALKGGDDVDCDRFEAALAAMPDTPSSDVLERVAAAIAREHTHLDKARAAIAAMPTIERLSAELELRTAAISETLAECERQGSVGPNRNADQVAQYLGGFLRGRVAALTASPQAAPESKPAS